MADKSHLGPNWLRSKEMSVEKQLTSYLVGPHILFVIRAFFAAFFLINSVYIPFTFTQTSGAPPVTITLSYLHTCTICIYFFCMVYKSYKNRALIIHLSNYRALQLGPASNFLPHTDSFKADTPLNWSDIIHWVLFECMAGCTLLVLVVYWALLAPGSQDSTSHGSIIMHLCTFIAMLTEIILSRQLIFPVHMVFAVVFTLIFYLDMVIYYFVSGDFIYNFFSWKKDALRGILFWVLAPVGYCIMYCIMMGIAALREYYLKPEYQASEGHEIGSHHATDYDKDPNRTDGRDVPFMSNI